MLKSRWPLALILAGCVSVVISTPAPAQQRPRSNNPGEEKFRPYRLEVKPANDAQVKLSAMKNGTVNLDPPIPEADQKVLDDMAKSLVYPVTHHEYYFAPESLELVTKSATSQTVQSLLGNLRAQLLFAPPGEPKPSTQLAFVREFGASSVRAIEDVLAKQPPAVIRVNALRMLTAVAETGAPAAWDAIAKLLRTKDDKNHPLEVLYWSLKAAEQAIGAYDREKTKWVTKTQYFNLIALVDDVVNKVPDVVAEKTYMPEKPLTTALTSGPKPPANPAGLTPEQADAMRAYRLQAVRALAKVRSDVVTNQDGDKERRPLHTLAKVVIADASLSPPPSYKEVGEAVIGLATMTPSDTVNTNVLAATVAWGVKSFAQEKVSAARELNKDSVQLTHWKVYGHRMKAAFTAWEKELQSAKVKLPKADKDVLTALSQLSISTVFEPLTKQTESGGVNVDKTAVENWYNDRKNAITSPGWDLYTDKPAYKLTAGTGR